MMRRLGGQLLIEAFISCEKQLSTLVIQIPDSRLFIKIRVRNSSSKPGSIEEARVAGARCTGALFTNEGRYLSFTNYSRELVHRMQIQDERLEAFWWWGRID